MLGNMLVGLVLVVFAVIISFSALKWFPEPYLWIFLTWASVFLCALRLVPRARTAWISLVILSCVLAGLEGFFWISGIWIYKDVKSESTFKWVSDNVLGFVAPKGVARTEAKYYRGEKLFDVVYTMDDNGLRITYAHPPSTKANRPCVLFFGDSYTFGWGLNDQETMPYRVATRAGEKYRVYNLAFPTHGAHQMLAALDHGLVGKEVDCAPRDIKYIIYVATPDHVRRAAGLRDIDFRHGPRYVLGADGSVSYQGQFGEDGTKMEKIGIQLAKSSFYRKLVGGDAIYTRRYNGADVTLYLAIVDAARAQIKNAYTNAEFHLLVWSNDAKDKDKALASQIIKGFSDKGFTVHRVEDILPGSSDNKAEYFLGGWDLHPNAQADDRIAQFVVHDILKQ